MAIEEIITMANHAEDDNDDNNGDIFVYREGRAPQHVTHAIIDKSVDEIEDKAFYNCVSLVKVETHDGIRRVGELAFYRCKSLRGINLKSAFEICDTAFCGCFKLVNVEFGDELETIEGSAFAYCTSLEHLKLPSIIIIEFAAFEECSALTDIELSERLETIGARAFDGCERLQRIAIPLKRDLFPFDALNDEYTQFRECEQLVTIELVGGIQKTVASLYMEIWSTEMIAEINYITQVLPAHVPLVRLM